MWRSHIAGTLDHLKLRQTLRRWTTSTGTVEQFPGIRISTPQRSRSPVID
jgi:hypothetical protein